MMCDHAALAVRAALAEAKIVRVMEEMAKRDKQRSFDPRLFVRLALLNDEFDAELTESSDDDCGEGLNVGVVFRPKIASKYPRDSRRFLWRFVPGCTGWSNPYIERMMFIMYVAEHAARILPKLIAGEDINFDPDSGLLSADGFHVTLSVDDGADK
jgi:hypothetical protein